MLIGYTNWVGHQKGIFQNEKGLKVKAQIFLWEFNMMKLLTHIFKSKWIPVYEKRYGRYLGESFCEVELSSYRISSKNPVRVQRKEWNGSFSWKDLSLTKTEIFLKKINTKDGIYFTKKDKVKTIL